MSILVLIKGMMNDVLQRVNTTSEYLKMATCSMWLVFVLVYKDLSYVRVIFNKSLYRVLVGLSVSF